MLIDKSFKSHTNEESALENAEPFAVKNANSSNVQSLFGCSISIYKQLTKRATYSL